MSDPPDVLTFSRERVMDLIASLERMAAGETEPRLPISPLHDELDAIAHGINVLGGELRWASAQVIGAHERLEADLRAAVERAERANESKNVFLRNVNHEIRTPITAMLAFADLLGSPAASSLERAEQVRRLRANGQAVLALLSDLLDLARLDADKLALTPEPVSVFELVREVQSGMELEARAKGLMLRTEASNDAFRTIQTDRYRLRQILVNLIGNALKFTEHGGVLVSLRTGRAPDERQMIVDVSDTGIGIAPERQALLFEPFEQGDASITSTYGGSGLGLALSRRLAEQLGGALALVRSVPGQGTTFRLTLEPLPSSLSPRVERAGTGNANEDEDISGLRVLLAEDHADIRIAVRRLLEEAGATVELARDGEEAVAKAKTGGYDVTLMDIRMPHLDGLQAARTLRTEGYAGPIVALTGDPGAQRRGEALDAGCDACLCKPFTRHDLIDCIRTLVGGRTSMELLVRSLPPSPSDA